MLILYNARHLRTRYRDCWYYGLVKHTRDNVERFRPYKAYGISVSAERLAPVFTSSELTLIAYSSPLLTPEPKWSKTKTSQRVRRTETPKNKSEWSIGETDDRKQKPAYGCVRVWSRIVLGGKFPAKITNLPKHKFKINEKKIHISFCLILIKKPTEMWIRNNLIDTVDCHFICNLKSSFERVVMFRFACSLVPFLGLTLLLGRVPPLHLDRNSRTFKDL